MTVLDSVFLRALGLIGLLTVLITVVVYVSRNILESARPRWRKALLVLGLTMVVLIVGLAGLVFVMYPFSEFD